MDVTMLRESCVDLRKIDSLDVAINVRVTDAAPAMEEAPVVHEKGVSWVCECDL
jgi:hypothetical protein